MLIKYKEMREKNQKPWKCCGTCHIKNGNVLCWLQKITKNKNSGARGAKQKTQVLQSLNIKKLPDYLVA